ncbi:MAG: DUF4097 family beta strand repeat protein [Lachnospiraceae bacterium]|nr:DUF4097 family beta strand repeat protein [Lachnospiraceae bacterium]
MKKFWKATLIPGIFCILAGIVLAAILALGFSDDLLKHVDEFSINENNFWEYFTNDKFLSITREGTRYNKSDTRASYHFAVPEGETISGIDFEIAVGDVQIRRGNTMEISVTDMFENAISSYVKDGVWYVTDSLLGSGSVHSEYSPEITITMPEELAPAFINLYLAAGRMDADHLNAEEVRLEVDAGSLKVFHLSADALLKIKNGVGEVKIYDATAKNLTVDAGVGAVDVTGAISGNNKINGGIGEVKISLTDRTEVDFNYNVTCGIGEAEIGDRVFHGNSENTSFDYNNADYFEVNCGIGHVEIDVNGN